MSNKTKKIVYCAMLVAVGVLLGYISRILNPLVALPFLRFSLAPVAVILAGALMGWKYGAMVGALTDLLTFLLASAAGVGGGAYFPAFTLTMALYGVLGGVFFYRKQSTVLRTTLLIILMQTVLSACLNTVWNVVLYGPMDPVKLGMRLATSYAACAVYVVVVNVLLRYKGRFFRLAEA